MTDFDKWVSAVATLGMFILAFWGMIQDDQIPAPEPVIVQTYAPANDTMDNVYFVFIDNGSTYVITYNKELVKISSQE